MAFTFACSFTRLWRRQLVRARLLRALSPVHVTTLHMRPKGRASPKRRSRPYYVLPMRRTAVPYSRAGSYEANATLEHDRCVL